MEEIDCGVQAQQQINRLVGWSRKFQHPTRYEMGRFGEARLLAAGTHLELGNK